MGIFEYDEEKHMQQIREESHAEGRISKLKEQVRYNMEQGRSVKEIADILVESPERIRELMEQIQG